MYEEVNGIRSSGKNTPPRVYVILKANTSKIKIFQLRFFSFWDQILAIEMFVLGEQNL